MSDVETVTPGCVPKLYRDEKLKSPVVQISKLAPTISADPNTPSRIKAEISDGEYFGAAILTSDVSQLFVSEEAKLHSLLRLTNFVTNTIGKTKMVIVLAAEVAVTDVDEKIGEPVSWETAPLPAVASTSPSAAKKEGANTPHTAGVASRTNPPAAGISPAPMAPMAPPVGGPISASRAMPIDSLNPYSSKWTIKARVTAKGDLRKFSSARGDGVLFSFDLVDDSAEIRATAFKEVAERLHPAIEVGKTYLISCGQLKVANKKWSTLNNNYEISLGYETQVQLCADEPEAAIKVHYRFVTIGDVAARPVNSTVDVIGIVHGVQPVTSLTSKAGKELTKRVLSVADDSGKAIEVTLWGNAASNFPDDAEGKPCAFKGMRVTEWNQKSLAGSFSSSFEVSPAHEAAERIQTWWTNGGSGTAESLSVDSRGGAGGGGRDTTERTLNADLAEKASTMAPGGEPEWATVRCCVSKHLGSDDKPIWYAACPKCTKKAVGDDASGFSCENCGWSGNDAAYRYIVPLILIDSSGTTIATAFNDQGASFIGKGASEMRTLKMSAPAEYDAAFGSVLWKSHLFRVRSKMDTYNGTSRVKTAIVSCSKLNYVSEGNILLKEIAKYA